MAASALRVGLPPWRAVLPAGWRSQTARAAFWGAGCRCWATVRASLAAFATAVS